MNMYDFDNLNQDLYDTNYPIYKMLNMSVDIDIHNYPNNNLDKNKNKYIHNSEKLKPTLWTITYI
jgi:hypothetical protein